MEALPFPGLHVIADAHGSAPRTGVAAPEPQETSATIAQTHGQPSSGELDVGPEADLGQIVRVPGPPLSVGADARDAHDVEGVGVLPRQVAYPAVDVIGQAEAAQQVVGDVGG